MRALTGISTREHFSKYAYLLKRVRRTDIDWSIVAKSPLGRYSCIAQGASPGLIIVTHLLSLKGAALPRRKANARAVSAAPTELLILLFAVYPGFHFGLCPHFTLGFAGVSPFQGSLSDWAFAVLCRGIVFVKCFWVCK